MKTQTLSKHKLHLIDSFRGVFAGMVPKPPGQVAQTREDGGSSIGPERLRALHDDRFAEPDARLEPGAARRSLAVTAPAVRAARVPVAPADRLPELPDAARRAQPVVRGLQVAAVAAATHRRGRVSAAVVLAAAAVLHGVFRRRRRRRPQDLVHSGAQAQGQGTRRVDHQRHANGLNRHTAGRPAAVHP